MSERERLDDIVLRAMNRERLVEELVNRAKQLGVVSVEAQQTRNLLHELGWNHRKQPDGKPWTPETRRYRKGLLSHDRKLAKQAELLEKR